MLAHALFLEHVNERSGGRSSLLAVILRYSGAPPIRSDFVGKRQWRGSDGRAHRRVAVPRARLKIEHREHFEAVADANRLDDTPGTAVAQVKRVAYAPVARGQAHSVEAPLDAAQVLGARDDFLPRVAALAEADAVQEIEIEHLCDEDLASRQIYLRQARANVRQTPVMFDFLRPRRVAPEPALGQGLRGPDDPVAAEVAVDGGHADAILLYIEGARWRIDAGGPQAFRIMDARDAQCFSAVFDLYLGSKHEPAQRFHGRRNQLTRQDRGDAAGMGQEMHDCEYAPLRARVRRQQAPVLREAARVIRYLTLQKALGVGSGESHDAQMR